MDIGGFAHGARLGGQHGMPAMRQSPDLSPEDRRFVLEKVRLAREAKARAWLREHAPLEPIVFGFRFRCLASASDFAMTAARW